MLRQTWFIGSRDTLHLLRQKETLLWIFIMPALFIYFIGSTTGGRSTQQSQADALLLRAPETCGVLVDEISRRLEQQDFQVVRAPLHVMSDMSHAGRDYRRLLVVPEPPRGYATPTDAVADGRRITLVFRSRSGGESAIFEKVRVTRAVYSVLADTAVLAGDEQPLSRESFRALAEKPRPLTLEVHAAGKRREPPTGFQQAVPGIMVMFTMLILVTGGSTLLVIERDQGLLRRLAATPIPRAAVVAGKWTSRMVLALIQIAFVLLLGSLLFHVSLGGTWPMACVILFGWSAFCASIALLLGNVARTHAQVVGIGVLASMVLAALGGCWWPIEVAPEWMQKIALALPTGWAMDAMHRLVSFGESSAAALPHFIALITTSFLIAWLAVHAFRYES